jgi:2'-5' RNA ligase
MNEDLQQHLVGIIQRMARSFPSIHWVDPASIHFTLSFLGELTDGQVAQATQAAEDATKQVKPFMYRLARLGVFGSPCQPRVIWLGIEEPSGVLLHLHHLLNTALEQCGFVIDTRPFSPHLTLARVKGRLTQLEQQRLQELLVAKQQDLVSHQTYHVRHIVVMKSELLRTGARYTLLQQYMLAAH